ncbi:MAG TPA: hypothetical protein VGE76_06775 [Opitutaceae bacterium]
MTLVRERVFLKRGLMEKSSAMRMGMRIFAVAAPVEYAMLLVLRMAAA